MQIQRTGSFKVLSARRTAIAAATLAAVTAEPVLAQLEEVIVTAQRREQSLRDVPVSVSVFDEARIERQQIEGLQDFAVLAPNVSYQNNGVLFDSDITIRGVSNIGGVLNVTGFYVDEFNVAPVQENATYDQRLLDVERIEVLRGPQGTLFGRNTTGGAISLTTKKPNEEFGGFVSADWGRFNTWQTRGAVNLPVSDTFFVRVNGFIEESDGFLNNEGPSNATNDYRTYGTRAAFRWLPSQNLTWDLSLSYLDHEQGFYSSTPTGEQVDSFEGAGLIPVPLDAGFFPRNTDTIATDRPLDIQGDTFTAINTLTWDLGGVVLKSVSGYIDHQNQRAGESDMTPFNITVDDGYEELDSWSTELRLESQNESGINWVIGALYAEDESEDFFARAFNEDWYTRYLRDVFGIPMGSVIPIPADGTVLVINDLANQEVTSWGIFGEVNSTLFDNRLSWSVGARFSNDEVFSSEVRDRFNAFPPFNSVFDTEAGEADFNDFLPRFTATWAVNDDVNLYGVISKGGKPGGFNLASVGVPGAMPTYDNEELWNYEFGVKGLFLDRTLSLNAAVFYIDWEDIQVSSFFFDGETFETALITENGPSAESQGFEADFAYQHPSGFSLDGGVGYNDATFGTFTDAIIDDLGNRGDVTGNTLPGTPEWTGSIAAQYTSTLGERQAMQGFLRYEHIYQGEMYLDLDNREFGADYLEDYDYGNVRAGLETDRWSLIASIENVFDDPISAGTRPQFSFSGVLATVLPRTWRLRFTYQLGE